jgi:hypothetical protein
VYQNDWSGFKRPYRIWKCTQKYISHVERNSRYSSFDPMRNPTPPSLVGPWRYKEKMATLGQKAFCVLHIAKCESVVSLQRVFGRQFQSALPFANSIGVGISSFRQRGAFVKGKVQDVCGRQKKVWNSVERVRQSFLRSPKKSVRHASRELEVSTMTVWRVLRKRLKWSPIVFTWCSFFNHFGTRCRECDCI